MENQADLIKALLTELKGNVSKPTSKKLDLDKCERYVERLASFSPACEDCQHQLLELHNHLTLIKENVDLIDVTKLKPYKQVMKDISSHLVKQHKLIQEGYYLSTYMSVGMSLGVVFGLVVFDNIALGIPIGLSMGLAIGAGLDADAKKKGKTI